MYGNLKYVKEQALEKNVFNSLSIRYLIAISAIAIAIIASEVLVQSFLKKQLNDSRVINVAGRQRMLSQKLTKEGLLLLHGEQDTRQQTLESLTQTVVLWKKSHNGLQHGDESLGLPGDNTEVVDSMFTSIRMYFQNIVINTENIIELLNKNLNAPSALILPHVQAILLNEQAFLKGMDVIVYQYDKEANNKVNQLIRLELLILAISLGILLFELLFIFRPTAFYTRRIIADLIKSEAREKKMSKEMLQRKTAEQKFMSELIFEGQERERRRIARDLHDGIGQLLTGLKFQIESINPDNISSDTTKLSALKQQSADIIKEIRRVSFNLRPSVLSDYGLASVLKNLAQEIGKLREDVQISFINKTQFNDRLEKKIETNLYRITQEAVNNALKYSKAANITITLSHDKYFLNLLINDNGTGFDEDEVLNREFNMNSGHGLFNMKERANLLNAEFDIVSLAGEGTEISVRVPLFNDDL